MGVLYPTLILYNIKQEKSSGFRNFYNLTKKDLGINLSPKSTVYKGF